VNESHSGATGHIEARGERRRAEHGDDGHAVHVVGDRFAVVDTDSAPALALGSLQTFKKVEERDG